MRSSYRLCALLACACGWLLAFSAPCWAESARILVISDPSTPEELEESARSTLSSSFDLADASGYLSAVKAQRLSPTSVAALTRFGLKLRARLVVTLEPGARGKLQVTLRDGSSGEVISEEKLMARGKHPKLSARAKHKLTASVRRALSGHGSGRGRSSADLDDDDDDDDDSSAASAKPAPVSTPTHRVTYTQGSAPRQPPPQPVAAAAAQPSEPEAEADEPVADEGPSSSEPRGPNPFAVRISAGGGGGARTAIVPTRNGGRDLDSGFSLPALELGLNVRYMLGSHWLVSGDIQFRTFFGLQAPGALPDGTITQTSVSSRSFVVGVAPGYRVGGPDSLDFRVLLGWAFRVLQSSEVAQAGASIQAAVVRPELRIPIADGVVLLRLAPELLVIVGVSATLPRNVPALARAGVGLGGELSLDVRVAGPVSLGVAYRESHGMVASDWSTGFADVERYAIGRLTLQL